MRPALVPPLLVAAALAGGCPGAFGPSEKELRLAENRLKQVGLAVHNFHDTTGRLPADLTDAAGRPLLSWRVALLPYLEQEALHRQFRLTEPWDSPHNAALARVGVPTYAPVRGNVPAGETYLQVFTGPGALFGGREPRRFQDVIDGLSNTGLVFEGGEAVPWTKPADLPFDASQPLPRLGGQFDGVCLVALCDGSVRRLRPGADARELKKLIMPADREAIDPAKLFD